jgi:hypothetical protein
MNQLVETNGIRRFSDANLQRAIDRTLAALPADRKVAVVAHADTKGAALSAVVRLGDEWSVMAAAYKPYGKPLEAEAQVVWSPA